MDNERDQPAMDRRTLLAAFLGASAAWSSGCGGPAAQPNAPTPPGELFGASASIGHQIRDGLLKLDVNAAPSEHCDVVVVGGGVAGLSAARRLKRAGVEDFVLLELETALGGTARSGSSEVSPYPWGAHYVPAPRRNFPALVELFAELDCFDGEDEWGDPTPRGHLVARFPQERLFYKGSWYDGLYLYAGSSEEDRRQFERFQSEIAAWVRWRGSDGKPAFTLPMAYGSTDDEPWELDRISMAKWMDDRQFNSPRLRWYVDYACRDDYGLRLEDTSAWAGVFYFASRMSSETERSRPFLTWPEGNGRIVAHLASEIRTQTDTGWAVCDIRHSREDDRDQIDVVAYSPSGKRQRVIRCQRVVFAAPQFLSRYLIRDYRDESPEHTRAFQYGAWAVCNFHLREAPEDLEFPLSWDNVIYESPSLGYVATSFQRGRDHGPAVWTYYYPVCDGGLTAARQRLLDVDREGWAEIALADLARPHPDIRRRVERIDVMRWGHAMILPTPGFVSSDHRVAGAQPYRGVHFAHSDLSGVALFEEAFYRGVNAAEDVLESMGRTPKRTV